MPILGAPPLPQETRLKHLPSLLNGLFMACREVTDKGVRKGKGERRGREAGFLLEPFPPLETFAAPGSLPTLIIWRDKRRLPHASTPPALQELAALIPLPEPFEVSCYLEQILQNAFESRVGEGTTATSTDTHSAHRYRREAVGVSKGHNRLLSHLLQACEGGREKQLLWALMAPLSHQSLFGQHPP